MVNACIYLEGGATGAHSKELSTRCQQAFHKLLDRMGFTGRKPRLVASGGRADVFDRFCTAYRNSDGGYVAMWIDSEEPIADIAQTWKHLAEVTTVARWEKPDGADDDQVLFMTTCMETWIVTDRETLRDHYGCQLQESALPSLNHLEAKGRHDVQNSLVHATRNCRNKYSKGKCSFVVLGQLDPLVLKQHLPSFDRVWRILNDVL